MREPSLSENQQLDISLNLAAFHQTTTFQSGVFSIIANMQTQAEDLAQLRDMFLKLDSNLDGVLSFDELEAGMQEIAQIFQMEEPDVRKMFKAADVNGDGHIDYSEFIVATQRKDLLLSTKNLRGAFEMFDLDGHGFICKEEIKQVFGDMQNSKKGEWIWDQIM